MKILVTGGAGFIGSHVVDMYIAEGHRVVVVDNLSTGCVSNINPEAKYYHIDIRDKKLGEVFEFEQPDIVNHHAAHIDIRGSITKPCYDADVNLMGSLNLIKIARQYKIKRFIYSSSGGAVYGEPTYLPCDESHPVNPLSPYGASKHFVEHYLYMYEKNFNLSFVILRYSNVYGPRQNVYGETGVAAIFTKKLLANEPVIINGDGQQTRDYIYVKDCAHANLLALNPNLKSSIYNLGVGKGVSVNQLFNTLTQLVGHSVPVINRPPIVGEIRHIHLDSTKARQKMGWKPLVSLEEGLAKTIEHIRLMEKIVEV